METSSIDEVQSTLAAANANISAPAQQAMTPALRPDSDEIAQAMPTIGLPSEGVQSMRPRAPAYRQDEDSDEESPSHQTEANRPRMLSTIEEDPREFYSSKNTQDSTAEPGAAAATSEQGIAMQPRNLLMQACISAFPGLSDTSVILTESERGMQAEASRLKEEKVPMPNA